MRSRRATAAVAAVAALLATNAVLLLTGSGLALPGSLANYFFGPQMVRAEVVMKVGGVQHDYRLDRGRIRAIAPGSLTLLERDKTLVTIQVAPNARITYNGHPVSFVVLRRGMNVLTVRDNDAPAELVQAGR